MNSSKNTMDSIKLPDQSKIDNLQDGFITKKPKNTGSFEDFDRIVAPTFARAGKVQDIPEKKEKENDPDDFIPKPDPTRKATSTGVKVGKRYVAKRRLAKIITGCVMAVVVILFFFPPFVTNNTAESGCEKRNIFQTMGLTELKEDMLKNKAVYSEEGLSSELSDSYRICKISLNISNMTPFELKIPGYEIVSAKSEYKSRFVYAAPEKNGGYIIPPFSNEPVTVEVLINVASMNDQQLDEAVTSLVLKTSGMKKKIGRSLYCPCIPAFVFVSNASVFTLD
ncbi:hypothetical protein [Ruminococcus sp. Marseille-P6503]|uniref:hypothetical protein n=1 Tax=Ruminococcus sp. Marseille-P6503 TaxID=2364796 RepID=UPI000F52211C|nr:hypothetical protein [Ruminococcus sp. Marseille-P6503]